MSPISSSDISSLQRRSKRTERTQDKAMALLKVIFIIAITMALSIALTMKSIVQDQESKADLPSEDKKVAVPPKRVSRFLAEKAKARNPNAADHCRKDDEVCYSYEGKNSTCCNNKCVDLGYDDMHCGACKRKCEYTETCCRGECVDLNFDKRHCGRCNHRCELGQYCVYALCDYA